MDFACLLLLNINLKFSNKSLFVSISRKSFNKRKTISLSCLCFLFLSRFQFIRNIFKQTMAAMYELEDSSSMKNQRLVSSKKKSRKILFVKLEINSINWIKWSYNTFKSSGKYSTWFTFTSTSTRINNYSTNLWSRNLLETFTTCRNRWNIKWFNSWFEKNGSSANTSFILCH